MAANEAAAAAYHDQVVGIGCHVVILTSSQ
jgi:hypothetical protein